MQGDAEAVRVARFGQQLLGAFRVVLDRLQVRVVAEQRGWHQVVGRLREAFHQAVLDALAVDGHADGIAHARILQRVLIHRRAFLGGDKRRLVFLVIGVKVDHAVRDLGEERQLRILAHLRQVRRRYVLDGLHVTGQQRRHAGGRVRDEAQRHLVPGGLGTPVVGVLHQLDPVVARVVDELEGAGADHALALREVVRGQALRSLLLHDEDRRQVVQHQRVRRVGGELDGVLVDHLLVDDRLGVDVELAGAVLDGGRTLERPDDIVGGEFRAVVELHALADLEFPGQVVHQLPGLGQAGNDLAVRIHFHQALEHVLRDVDVGEQIVEVRIHRGRGRTHGQLEIDRVGLAGKTEAHGRGYHHGTECLLACAKGHRATLPGRNVANDD